MTHPYKDGIGNNLRAKHPPCKEAEANFVVSGMTNPIPGLALGSAHADKFVFVRAATMTQLTGTLLEQF